MHRVRHYLSRPLLCALVGIGMALGLVLVAGGAPPQIDVTAEVIPRGEVVIRWSSRVELTNATLRLYRSLGSTEEWHDLEVWILEGVQPMGASGIYTDSLLEPGTAYSYLIDVAIASGLSSYGPFAVTTAPRAAETVTPTLAATPSAGPSPAAMTGTPPPTEVAPTPTQTPSPRPSATVRVTATSTDTHHWTPTANPAKPQASASGRDAPPPNAAPVIATPTPAVSSPAPTVTQGRPTSAEPTSSETVTEVATGLPAATSVPVRSPVPIPDKVTSMRVPGSERLTPTPLATYALRPTRPPILPAANGPSGPKDVRGPENPAPSSRSPISTGTDVLWGWSSAVLGALVLIGVLVVAGRRKRRRVA